MEQKKILALFDFDGTITKKDTLFHFTRYAVGNLKYYTGLIMISPALVAFKLNWLSAQKAKEFFLRHYFKGWMVTALNEKAESYAQNRLEKIIRPEARAKINSHKQAGHHIYVVTASVENWVAPWCNKMDIGLIGSKFNIKNGRISGKLLGKNCNGAEKVVRIKQTINLETFSKIYAYGDSQGDWEMLQLADRSFMNDKDWAHDERN